MEHYIGVLADEGVTFVPIWTESKEEKKAEGVAAKEAETEAEEEDSEKKGAKTEGGSTVAQVSLSSTTEFPIPLFLRFRHVLFGEFPCPAWAVASCRGGPQAGGTP